MRWDLSNLSNINPDDLLLLVDTDNDGQFSDETPIAGAVDAGAGIYEFTNVGAVANNTRFTVALASQLLPIELADFSAAVSADQTVALQWTTLTELNNDYFTLERSADGIVWEVLKTVAGAGNSQEALTYYEEDSYPLKGISYYRLKQTDVDGQYSYSTIRAVEITPQNKPLLVYPNPTVDKVVLQGPVLIAAELRVFNAQGQEVTTQIRTANSGTSVLTLDLSALPKGVYIIQTPTQVRQVTKQ
jgi:hypothetical protein